MFEKVVNPACERNQQPIMAALAPFLRGRGPLLELASGTGQHGVYMSSQLPELQWQLTEQPASVLLCEPWRQEAQLANLLPCIALDVREQPWPVSQGHFQYGYCANLLHFVSADDVDSIFYGMAKALQPQGLFFCYGPINENGFTSDGNANLDEWLKQDVNAQAGIKEFTFLQSCANAHGFRFKNRLNLPANNVILIFEKQTLK